MLISFSVGNFLSFRDKAELSMVAIEGDHSLPGNKSDVPLAKEKSRPLTVLKSAAIYGPNAGGKSNFLRALGHFSFFIIHSANMHENEPLLFPGFALDPQKRLSPSEFEIRILLDGIFYRYGFSADSKQVHDEWLFIAEKGKERFVFERIWDRTAAAYSYEFGQTGKRFEKFHRDGAIRNNALLLSIASQGNVKSAKEIIEYISRIGMQYIYDGSIDDTIYIPLLTSAMRFADIGINAIVATPRKESSENGQNYGKAMIDLLPGSTEKKKYAFNLFFGQNRWKYVYADSEGNHVPISESLQSDGTKRFFMLILQLSYIYANGGGLVIIDEVDTSLHPALSEAFLKFVHQLPDAGLQLICTTHNPLLLNQDVFRRDQVWIAEKDRSGASSLTALSDFKGLRKESRLGKQYLEGRFGGLPILDSFALKEMLQQLAELSSKENR